MGSGAVEKGHRGESTPPTYNFGEQGAKLPFLECDNFFFKCQYDTMEIS